MIFYHQIYVSIPNGRANLPQLTISSDLKGECFSEPALKVTMYMSNKISLANSWPTEDSQHSPTFSPFPDKLEFEANML